MDFVTHRLFGMKIPNKLLIFWENTHTTRNYKVLMVDKWCGPLFH